MILYAPNVHTGGGRVLLQALLDSWPTDRPLQAILDRRAQPFLVLPKLIDVAWVKPSIGARLFAEFQLRKASARGRLVLCFHGLPPLLPNPGRVILFQQNRIYLGQSPLWQFAFKTRVRLFIEILVSHFFRRRVTEYIVQTPSMSRALTKWYGSSRDEGLPVVQVLPFIGKDVASSDFQALQLKWDFIYVADGEAHKNHRILMEAWCLLAREGLRPSLVFTLNSRDRALRDEIEGLTNQYEMNVKDLGQISREEILGLYKSARALVYPSTSESFGLPLIEASAFNLPILASELDYVRDVCVPAETFDPLSAVSIARAVKRFLKHSEPPLKIHTAAEFWQKLLVSKAK